MLGLQETKRPNRLLLVKVSQVEVVSVLTLNMPTVQQLSNNAGMASEPTWFWSHGDDKLSQIDYSCLPLKG